ncbi:MAG: xylulokinase [Candidatus Bipolaricaulia bacterium]
MAVLLGIDLGTTGAKVLALNEDGTVLAQHTEEYPLDMPRPGWAEQHPETWWDAVVKAIQNVTETEQVKSDEVRGLALSGQMHGSVFLDEQDEVIRPAILWCDTRTTEQCRQISEAVGEQRLYELVGNPALEGFTAPKLLWLREYEPENYGRVKTMFLPKDYIVYRLTGRKGTEVSDAAGTILFDVSNRRWSDELLRKLDLSRSILPEVLESIDPVGELTEEAANRTGLPRSTVVVAGGADNACSAVGNGIVQEGLVSSSIGSSGVVLGHTDRPRHDPKGRLHSFNHSVPNRWYLMGVMLAAGLSLKWFREQFAGETSYRHLDEEAAAVPVGSEGLLFLPYLNGERTPHRDGRARGVFFGLSPRHGRGHFVRAILEGVAFGLRDSLELLKALGVQIEQVRITGGGARSPLWRQIQADVFNTEVVTTGTDEGPAFGAALLAGVGTGVYRDVAEAVQETVKLADRIEPIPKHVRIYDALYPVYRSLYPALKDAYQETFRIVTGG